MIDRRAILDLTTMLLTFTGPGDTKIDFSPGSESFQMLQAPSGHLMLPCCEFAAASTAPAGSSSNGSMTLMAQNTSNQQTTEGPKQVASSSEAVRPRSAEAPH